MFDFPIGVMLDSFRMPVREALDAAVGAGAKGIQVYATRGDFSPRNMTAERRAEFLDAIGSRGLVISALCGDLGFGFWDPSQNLRQIDESKRILELAGSLGTDIVTTHIGVIPADRSHERYKIMQEACFELSRCAEGLGARFAIETGPEPADVLRGFLDGLGCAGMAVNLDPANFVMVTGDDPVRAVYTLKDYIVHTHAKDGKKLMHKDPEIVYRMIEEEMKTGKSFIETPLGEGHVDFPNYLKALDAIGYRGFLTVEREVGENPAADITRAVYFLTNLIQSDQTL